MISILRTSIASLAFLVGLAGCASLTGTFGARSHFKQAFEQGPDSLKKLCGTKVPSACALLGSQSEPTTHRLSIAQGVSDATSVRLTVVAPKREALLYFVGPKGGDKFVRVEAVRVQRSDHAMAVDQLSVKNLDLKGSFELLVSSYSGELWDRRTFKALDLNKKYARVALLSCMDDRLKKVADVMWPQVMAQKPDAMLLIGDNVYADSPLVDTPAKDLWKRYVETRQELKLYYADALIPLVATWDDHDYGRNDGDSNYAFKNESAEVFFAFFPQKLGSTELVRGPGVSSWWNAFHVNFALLDDRSFRTPNKQDQPGATHFGPEQEQWLQKQMSESTKPVLLVSGDQFFGGYHPFESYEGSHPLSFKERMVEWKKSPVPLLFLSGDRHLTEIMNIEAEVLGYPTYEITSSGVHAKVFADALTRNPNPRRLVGAAGKYNYSILEIMRASRHLLELSVAAFGDQQNVLYQKTLKVKHP
jgi:alkaline phosphatase D